MGKRDGRPLIFPRVFFLTIGVEWSQITLSPVWGSKLGLKDRRKTSPLPSMNFVGLDLMLQSVTVDQPSVSTFLAVISNFLFDMREPAPPAHTQEPQLLHTVPSFFDRNNDLNSFMDEFERELGMEPMGLRMPRLNPCVKKSIAFKANQPMDLFSC
ncbi:hypothetical protein TNCV_2513611 [Trichonephila clavipes]|nr:hypothetical protein TNCV_2513611 [Trichonephila clavipes]